MQENNKQKKDFFLTSCLFQEKLLPGSLNVWGSEAYHLSSASVEADKTKGDYRGYDTAPKSSSNRKQAAMLVTMDLWILAWWKTELPSILQVVQAKNIN